MAVPPRTPFTVEVVDVAEAVLVWVSGHVDIATAPRLREVLDRVADRDCEIDLTHVSFVDTSVLNVLLRHHVNAWAEGGSLRVVAASYMVRYLLEFTGYSKLLLADSGEPDPPQS